MYMYVLDRPQHPLNVTVHCGTTTAEVGWWTGNANNAVVTGYTVYYSLLDAGDGSYDSAEVGANSTSVQVPVKPWLGYSFYVEASNAVGRSDASEVVNCTTQQTAPFRHPHRVCTETRLSNQLVIVWQVTIRFRM